MRPVLGLTAPSRQILYANEGSLSPSQDARAGDLLPRPAEVEGQPRSNPTQDRTPTEGPHVGILCPDGSRILDADLLRNSGSTREPSSLILLGVGSDREVCRSHRGSRPRLDDGGGPGLADLLGCPAEREPVQHLVRDQGTRGGVIPGRHEFAPPRRTSPRPPRPGRGVERADDLPEVHGHLGPGSPSARRHRLRRPR